MTRNQKSLRGSQPGSGESEDESPEALSPRDEKTPSRGRRPQIIESSDDVEMVGAKS